MAMFNGTNYERISACLIDALRHNLVRNFINILQKFGSNPTIENAKNFNKQHRYGIVYEMNHIRSEIGEAPRLLEVIFHHLPHVLSFVMNYNFTKVFAKCPQVFQATKWDLFAYKKQQQMEIQEAVSHHFELQIPVDKDNSMVSIEKYIEGVITGVYPFPIWRKNSIITTPSVSESPTPKKKPKKQKKDDGEIVEKRDSDDKLYSLHDLIVPINELTETVLYKESNPKVIQALTMKIRCLVKSRVNEMDKNHMTAFEESLEEKYAHFNKTERKDDESDTIDSDSEFAVPLKKQKSNRGEKRATTKHTEKAKEKTMNLSSEDEKSGSEVAESPGNKKCRTKPRQEKKLKVKKLNQPKKGSKTGNAKSHAKGKKSAMPKKTGKKKM
jgi:hypothetical protein